MAASQTSRERLPPVLVLPYCEGWFHYAQWLPRERFWPVTNRKHGLKHRGGIE